MGNKRLLQERELFFGAIAQVLLAGACRAVVLVDWTDLEGGKCALAAAVPSDGRALPIYVEVHPEEKLSDPTVESSFLDALKRVLPAVCTPVIVKERAKGRRHSSAKSNPRASAANRKCQRRAREPWLLSTSLTKRATRKVVALYRTRMQIEEAFRDTKNHRFGWCFEDARSRSCARAGTLLLIASMAMLALTVIGRCAEKLGIHRGYQANTTRHKRVLSLFVLGKLIVQRGALAFLTPLTVRDALCDLRATVLAHSIKARG